MQTKVPSISEPWVTAGFETARLLSGVGIDVPVLSLGFPWPAVSLPLTSTTPSLGLGALPSAKGTDFGTSSWDVAGVDPSPLLPEASFPPSLCASPSDSASESSRSSDSSEEVS